MTIEIGDQHEFKERWISTPSISVMLRPDSRGNGLILVRNFDEWGIPAGGLKKGEYLVDGIRREIQEETNITEGNIYFTNLYGNRILNVQPVYTLTDPQQDKTSIGLVFMATYHGPRLPNDGWEIESDKKVRQAKPFKLKEIVKLLNNHLEGNETVYRQVFNFPLLVTWLLLNNKAKYVRQWLESNESRIEYFGIKSDSIFRDRKNYIYSSPVMCGEQNIEAQQRKDLVFPGWGKRKMSLI